MRATPAPVTSPRRAARRLGALALLALALAVVLARPLPASAAARRRAPKLPDLAIGAVTFDDHALKGGTDTISFCARVTNAGRAPTLNGVEATLALVEPDGTSHIRARFAVGRLWPAGARLRTGARLPHSVHDCSRPGDVGNLPIGAYSVHVCAFQKPPHRGDEQRPHGLTDNCKLFHKAFFHGRRSWTGTVHGDQGTGSQATTTWQAAAVTFGFTGYTSPGRFAYALTAGSVNYQVTATRGPCSEAGGGTLQAASGTLEIDHLSGHYAIRANVSADGTVPTVVTCPGASAPADASVPDEFLDDGFQVNLLPAFGQPEQLVGHFARPDAGITEDDWSLR